MKKAVRVYSGPDGESHFEEIDIPSFEKMGPSSLSEPMPARDVFFIASSGEHDSGWHRAPCRQMIVITGGELEVEVGSGEKRLFKPDDILMAEDTTGRGHLSRTRDRKAVVVRFP